jgi:hypothetical protein
MLPSSRAATIYWMQGTQLGNDSRWHEAGRNPSRLWPLYCYYLSGSAEIDQYLTIEQSQANAGCGDVAAGEYMFLGSFPVVVVL